MVDIKDPKEDQNLLDGIRARIKEHEADLALERDRLQALEDTILILKHRIGSVSRGKPCTVVLAEIMPRRLVDAPLLGRILMSISINVTLPARLCMLALRVGRSNVLRTCRYLEFAIKDEKIREAYHAKLVELPLSA